MDWLTFIPLAAALITLAPCHGLYKDSLKCPTRLLKGGRVRIRNRGRVAKYVCLRGYQVLGDKYSTCIRGKWDSPLPVCINGGCLPIYVPNGQVLETYRGAFVTVHCDPGFSLVGTQSLYCNGADWNDTVPVCKEINVQAQKWCDFEDEELCGWTHDVSHDFDWRRHNFATPSGHFNTGPTFDHTLGPGLNGHYMYLETSSPRLENDTARLFSPVFGVPSNLISCFIFWYHMFGVTTGSLNVYLHNQNTALLLSLMGDQGNSWHQAIVPLPRINSSFQIVIEGVRGTGYVGDTAIDDVKIAEGDECTTTSRTGTVPSLKGDDASCENRCFKSTDSSSLCNCTPDCINSRTCCLDYRQKCFRATTSDMSTPRNENEETDLKYTLHQLNTPNTTVMPLSDITNPEIVVTTTPKNITLNTTNISTHSIYRYTIEEITKIPLTKITTSKMVPNVPTTVTLTLGDFKNTGSLFSLNPKLAKTTLTSNRIHETFQTSTEKYPLPNTKYVFSSGKTADTSIFSRVSTSLPNARSTNRIIINNHFSWFSTMAMPKITTTVQPTKSVLSLSTKLEKNKQKIEFLTPPPPIVFWTPKKAVSWPFQQFTRQNNSIYVAIKPTTLFYPKFTRNISKNDVLHLSWDKDILSGTQTTHLQPKVYMTPPSTTKTKFHIPITSNTSSLKPISENKWRSKYKQKDEVPVHAQYAIPAPSTKVVHVILLVSIVLLILSAVLLTTCIVRRRKINRRSFEDDELDIRFLASDEILDFTLARPDSSQVCESMR